MKGLLLATDLMFSSRVTGAALAASLDVEVCTSIDRLLERAALPETRLILIDLSTPQISIPELVPRLRTASPRAHILAFGAHVDVESLQEARLAGCDEVVTRGQFLQTYARTLGDHLKTSE